MTQSRKFILRQIAALTRLGVPEMDIERSISWVDAHLPAAADAAMWIPSAADLRDDLISEATVMDAKQAVENGKDRRLARVLNARQVD